MHILHASWRSGTLWLHCETEDSRRAVAPSAAVAEAIAAVLGWRPAAARPAPATGWQPSESDGAATVAAPEDAAGGIRLSWPALCDLFAAVPPDGGEGARPPRQTALIARGVVAAADLLGWACLWRFAGSLVARQRYLPSIVRGENAFEARWMPVAPEAAIDPEAPAAARDAAREFVAAAVDFMVRRASTTILTRAHSRRSIFQSVHDAWFAALRDDSPAIRWQPESEIEELRATLARWRLPATVDSALVGFRLEAPPAGSEPGKNGAPRQWLLRATFGGVGGGLPLETSGRIAALTALGQAARICPLLEEASAGGGIGGPLSASQAHSFLSVFAPRLEAAGFKTELPAWWKPADGSASDRIALRGEVTEIAGGLATVRWEVALGDETLSPADIDEIGRSGEALVACRGRWIEADRRTVAAARRIRDGRRDDRIPVTALLRLAAGGGTARGLPVAAIGATGPARRLFDSLVGGASAPDAATRPPAGFAGTLRPYQLRGLSWLLFLRKWGFGACLADDMGLGKTIQALALVLAAREAGERRPALLACPTTIIGNWAREAARFAPSLRVHVHHGPDRLAGAHFAAEAARSGLVITGYSLLPRDFADLRGVEWSGVILDEAQNIKNASTRQSRAARAIKADYRVALTGTPVENNVGELWTLMDFLNPGLLGDRATFRSRIQIPLQTGIDPSARPRLRRLVHPFILRRMKTDPEIRAELPEKFSQKVFCPLTREQARLYAAELRRLDDGLATVSSAARRGLVLAAITRLKQICNHPAHYLDDDSELEGRSGKMERLEAMVGEMLEAGDRALVFTQFVKMGELIRRRLDQLYGCGAPLLHGGLPREERDRMVAGFQSPSGPPVFILSLRAGGTGLNLTAANRVIHYDRWWNPAVENQATDRAYRIGQTRAVSVHAFLCAGTLEERIDSIIEEKTRLAGDIVGEGESWLSDLSDRELRATLELSADSVAE